nr:biopolymer transporter ExbD [uncultured Holophaga sp.]
MDEKEFDQLNIIPLVDVMLVVLAIVLTTSTFIAKGVIPVDLPRASHNHEELQKSVLLELDRQGGIYLDGKAASLSTLAQRLGGFDRKMAVLIRSDRELQLQSFIDVLDLVKGMGFTKVSVQTDKAERR